MKIYDLEYWNGFRVISVKPVLSQSGVIRQNKKFQPYKIIVENANTIGGFCSSTVESNVFIQVCTNCGECENIDYSYKEKTCTIECNNCHEKERYKL